MLLSAEEWDIVRLSVAVAARATFFALLFAIATGLLLRRRFRGRLLVEVLLHAPLVLPPVVTGYVLLLLFGLNGPLGSLLDRYLHLRLVFTANGAALAAGVTAFPLMLRSFSLSLAGVDPRLEDAAAMLGAGWWRRTATVTLPLTLHGIVSAGVIGFAMAIGAFGAVITFAANIPGETRTIPLAIYSALQMPGGETVAARLALVSVALSLAALSLSEWLLARHNGKLAR